MFDHVEPKVLNMQLEMLRTYANLNPQKYIVDGDITFIQMLTKIEIMEINRLVPVKRARLKEKRT